MSVTQGKNNHACTTQRKGAYIQREPPPPPPHQNCRSYVQVRGRVNTPAVPNHAAVRVRKVAEGAGGRLIHTYQRQTHTHTTSWLLPGTSLRARTETSGLPRPSCCILTHRPWPKRTYSRQDKESCPYPHATENRDATAGRRKGQRVLTPVPNRIRWSPACRPTAQRTVGPYARKTADKDI